MPVASGSCRAIKRIESSVRAAAKESISRDTKRLAVSGSALVALTPNCATGHIFPSETEPLKYRLGRESHSSVGAQGMCAFSACRR